MKKFFYLLIVFILGIFVSYISYNSNKYDHINHLVDTAIEEGKYEEIAKIFGGCCDTNGVVKLETEKVDVAVFSGTSILDVTYGEERSYAYEETYYLYFFDLEYDYATFDGTDNAGAIVFNGDNGESYKYPLVVSESTNSEYLEKENFTKETALFNSTRNIVSNVDTWDFMYVNLTKSMIECINNYLKGGKIAGFTLLDNKGNEVVEVSATLDLSQKFFTDVNELIREYNVWLEAYDKNEDVKEAEKKFNEFYEPWLEEFNANKETTGYSFPYDSDYVVPGKVLWKTIGHLAIYTAIMFGFYLLFFHLEQLKELCDRIFKKKKKGEKPKTIHIKKDEPVVEAEVYEEPKLIEAEEVIETESTVEPDEPVFKEKTEPTEE